MTTLEITLIVILVYVFIKISLHDFLKVEAHAVWSMFIALPLFLYACIKNYLNK